MIFGYIVDGFLLMATLGVTFVSTASATSSIHRYIDVRNAESLHVILASEGSSGRVNVYTKE